MMVQVYDRQLISLSDQYHRFPKQVEILNMGNIDALQYNLKRDFKNQSRMTLRLETYPQKPNH